MRIFHVRCPSCSTEFPIDPEKVPPGGVSAICSECDRVFQVDRPAATPPEPPAPTPAPPTFALEEPPVQVRPAPAAPVAPPEPPPSAAPSTPAAPPAAPPPPKKTSIATPKGKPPFVDLSSFANDTLSQGEPEPAAPSAARGVGKEKFGKRDPHERARHLARVLVSDIIAYYPVRYQESLAKGTLKQDFENEVKKSWKEYVDQVGIEMAESTPYFNQALNEVLARGKPVF